jgi:hypothetical protein
MAERITKIQPENLKKVKVVGSKVEDKKSWRLAKTS